MVPGSSPGRPTNAAPKLRKVPPVVVGPRIVGRPEQDILLLGHRVEVFKAHFFSRPSLGEARSSAEEA